MNKEFAVRCCDAMEFLRSLPDGGADIVLTDPPYNMGKDMAWDKRADYLPWMVDIFKECSRVTRAAGQLIFWHNSPTLMGEIWHALREVTPWRLRSFIIVHKPGHRRLSWVPADNGLRSWFTCCEYVCCLDKSGEAGEFPSGKERLYSHPDFSAPIRAYFIAELSRAGLTPASMIPLWQAWGQGGTGAITRHYFAPSQWEMPTREKYEAFFQDYLRNATGVTDLFPRPYDTVTREVDGQLRKFEGLRQEFERLRPVHNTDAEHGNVWLWPGMNDSSLHICRKPLTLLQRLIRVHTNPGELVLDPFCGSGSTAEACRLEGRRFAGCDSNPKYTAMTEQRWRDTPRPLPFDSRSANFGGGGGKNRSLSFSEPLTLI